MQSITYRRLLPAESAQYRTIRLECLKTYPENFGSTYEEESAKPKLAFESFIEGQFADKFVVGALDGETLIGIASFFQEPGRRTNHRGSLIQVFVQPGYQGKGIGKHLMQAAISEAFKISELEQIELQVVATNTTAIRIYEQLGFVEYGLVKNCFKNADGYVHEKEMVLFRR